MNSDLKIQDLGETARTDSLGRDLFSQALSRHGQKLERGETATLQINVGLLCNQSCRHCHVSAGPQRKEIMDSETVEAVIAYARRNRFNSVDITGGAPELNPHITRLIEGLSPLTSRLMVRSNLTVLNGIEMEALTALFIKHRVILMASFPSLNEEQTDSQRGPGTFKTSLNVLRKLNSLGYGQTDSGLELHLVSNPNDSERSSAGSGESFLIDFCPWPMSLWEDTVNG
jgi:radical SAM/Cys-rich protein